MAPQISRADRFKAQFGIDTTSSIPHPQALSDTAEHATSGMTLPTLSQDTDLSQDSSESHNMNPGFGEVAPSGMRFSPVLAVIKFPYKYISRKEDRQSVSDRFFARELIWSRSWDLYWVRSPFHDAEKAYIFVPEQQLEHLVDEIRIAFPKFGVQIPSADQEPGLVVDFEDHPDLRPRWLGTSSSKAEYESLQSQAHQFTMPPQMPCVSQSAYFKKRMDDAVDAGKQKSKFVREKKQGSRLEKQQSISRAFRRAQRYLGLSPTKASGDTQSAAPELIPLDVDKVVPFDFDADVVIIAVDCEAWENNNDLVTEIGVATLDTRNLWALPPGHCGTNWRSQIHTRHFRIDKYMHIRNSKYVQGCPDKFEFGESEIISQEETPRKIAECFRPPYSKVHASPSDLHEKRNIVFLGHDPKNDVKYLRLAGYDVGNLSNMLEIHDTSNMYSAFAQQSQQSSLAHILNVCEVEPWHLHNAGNDAAYTLQAMLGLCVMDAVENRGANKAERNEERMVELDRKVVDARVEAEKTVREEAKGWELDDGDDGGAPDGLMSRLSLQ